MDIDPSVKMHSKVYAFKISDMCMHISHKSIKIIELKGRLKWVEIRRNKNDTGLHIVKTGY